jgi:protein-S-isoprenylcysteine O-methyltransferase Ste14
MVYVAGVIDHSPKFEFLIWSATLGSVGYTMSRAYPAFKAAEAHAGPIKQSATLFDDIAQDGESSNLTPLAKLALAQIGQAIGRFLPPTVYWVSSLRHGWGQPVWESRWYLPVPTGNTAFWGMVTEVNVERINWLRGIGVILAVGIEFFQLGVVKTLGDQFNDTIGVREKPRLVDDGAFRVVRHPMYRFASGLSSLNLQSRVLTFPGIPCLVELLLLSSRGRLPSGLGSPSTPSRSLSRLISSRFPSRYFLWFIRDTDVHAYSRETLDPQEKLMEEDPELGLQYKAYKMKLPWRLIPYVW